MKILWLGMVASNEMFNSMPARTIGQASAHAAQNGIINGIDKNNIIVDTISAHNFPPYPRYPNIKVNEVEWSRTPISEDFCIGFVNIKYLSHIFKLSSLKNAVKNWVSKNSSVRDIHIIVYSLHSPLLAAANYAKKLNSNIKVHLIVPDLPYFVDMGAGRFKKSLKKIDWIVMRKIYKQFDSYILFTKEMAKFMEIEELKWTVIEGVANIDEILDIEESYCENVNSNEVKNNKMISIMYAGAIDKYRGIIELVEAFMTIENPNLELWLAGAGSSVDYVKEKAEIDPRIKYLGYISDRKKVIELEGKADILINTGIPKGEVSRYSFPFKLFEYMASGNPVITVKSQGIPEEYFKYVIGINSMERQHLLTGIYKLLDMDESKRLEIGQKGRQFVFENKNQIKQSRKLIDFIKS